MTREYYQKNKIIILEKMRRYYFKNREQKLAYAKQYKQDNLQLVRERNRAYYHRHKHRLRSPREAYNKEWRRKNPDKVRAIARRGYIKRKNYIFAYGKTYRHANRARISTYMNQYRINNREAIAETQAIARMIGCKIREINQDVLVAAREVVRVRRAIS